MAKHSHVDNSTHGYIWIPPGIVNFSFATELLLKATIYFDLRRKGWGHKLFNLYQTLSEPTKNKIEEAYKKYRKENEKLDQLPAYKIVVSPANSQEYHTKGANFDEIRNLLEIHSESFENWRYFHEFGQEGILL